MIKGLSVVSGSTHIHKLLNDGTVSFSGSVQITGTLLPDGDALRTLGTPQNRWADIYAQQTTVGAVFETGLTTVGMGKLATGTIVIWNNGKAVPCTTKEDHKVIGVVLNGKDQPIIIGAEYVLVTGKIEEGDWIVTSDYSGHGMAAVTRNRLGFKKDLHGRIIGQALQSADNISVLIKCFIKKM